MAAGFRGSLTVVDVIAKFNITQSGNPDGQPLVFAHGYGCDQNMWRFVTPAFSDEYRIVLFDYVGAGGSDLASYDPERYASLDAYADDVVEIVRELDLRDVILVAHSVSSSIGALAAIKEPDRFARLVMVCPSPRFINDGQYVGGFEESDIEELLESLESNYLGWSGAMAPVIMGNPDKPELGQELTESFCRTDPEIARRFAHATFRADNRTDFTKVPVRTLVLQCTNDVIAPVSVGMFVRDAVPDSTLVMIEATGHCPHMSAPDLTTEAIQGFLRESATAGAR